MKTATSPLMWLILAFLQLLRSKKRSGFWMEQVMRVFIFQPAGNYNMPDSKCYFATYSETRNSVSWKVSWEKWHNNKYTEMVTVTNGDEDVRVPLSSYLGLWTTSHAVTYQTNKLDVELIYLVCCLQTQKIYLLSEQCLFKNIFCSWSFFPRR